MKIQVKFYPDVNIKSLDYGTMSEISWQRLEPFLLQALNIKDNERLIGITATEYGVKGSIEYTDGTIGLREIPKPQE